LADPGHPQAPAECNRAYGHGHGDRHGSKARQAGPVFVPYDYLVLATGATHSYFGHPEWADVAPGLKQIEDATAIRRKVLLAFERAELARDADQSNC
jgi:NADH dehydrogenase FAD-containing subunit